MKRIICIVLLLVLTLCMVGCSYKLDKLEGTNLEFWITEEVDSWQPEGYTQRYGIMGGAEFYGTGYVPCYLIYFLKSVKVI